MSEADRSAAALEHMAQAKEAMEGGHLFVLNEVSVQLKSLCFRNDASDLANRKPLTKAAAQPTMLADPGMITDATTNLLAKAGADKALDDFFAFVWPATTALSVAWVGASVVATQLGEGIKLKGFIAVSAFFLLIQIALYVPF